MREIQNWSEKAQENLQRKRKNYLNIYGNLKECIRMTNQKSPKKFPVSDSEDFSQSGVLERHVRGGSQHLSYPGRNHVLEGYKYNSTVKDKNKSISQISESNGDRLSERIRTIDIINPNDQSISTKGPIIAASDIRTPANVDSEPQSQLESSKISKKSKNLNSKGKSIDFDPNLKRKKDKSLKETLEQKISESKEKIKNYSRQAEEEKEELVGYPSYEGEGSDRRVSDLQEMFDNDQLEQDEPERQEESPKISKFDDKPECEVKQEEKDEEEGQKNEQEPVVNKPSEGEKSLEGFPSIGESQSNIRGSKPMLEDDILAQILDGEEHDPLCDDKLFDSDSKPGINDRNSEALNLDASALSEPQAKDILIASSRSNIPASEKTEEIPNLASHEASPFGEKEKVMNKPEPDMSQESCEIDPVPQASDSIIEGEMPKILLPPNSDSEQNQDLLEEEKDPNVANTDTLDVKEPDSTPRNAPSISDILNEDLTGGGVEDSKPTVARTAEDIIPTGAKTKDEKADFITEQLLFYLKMELMANVFPQRVNVDKCKERTEKELSDLESKKSEESMIASEAPLEDPKLGEAYPENKMAIKTDKDTIKSYTTTLFSKMAGREEDFIGNLSSPLQRNPLEILMHLQNTIYELEEEEQLPFQQSVLPVDIYLDIERGRRKVEEEEAEKVRAEARLKHEEEKATQPAKPKPTSEGEGESDSASSFTKDEELDTKLFNLKCEWENIHNKAIFDAVNEALDGLRPYGLKGPPLPWSKQSRTLTYKNGDPTEIPQITQSIEKKILTWIGDQDEGSASLNTWEERLAVILANEIEETEPIWTDYEFEETHVKIDMAELILDDLFKEAADIMAHRKVLPREEKIEDPEQPIEPGAEEGIAQPISAVENNSN